MIAKAIQDAILAGEAVLAEKKAEEAAKEARRSADNARWRQEALDAADVWARDVLPDKILELTASGKRAMNVNGYQARACEKIGMTVSNKWVDEGTHFGDYWSYTLTW